jgi:hypothetical protein
MTIIDDEIYMQIRNLESKGWSMRKVAKTLQLA